MNGPRRICDDDVVLAEDRDVERAQVGVDPLRRERLVSVGLVRLDPERRVERRRVERVLEDPVDVAALAAVARVEVRAVAERDLGVRAQGADKVDVGAG